MFGDLIASRARPSPELPPRTRIYAIGDVHGRLDLLQAMLDRIEADNRARGGPRPTVLQLGDLIDRGPESAGVVALMMAGLGWADLVCLKGNHESAMLGALAGDHRAARMWLGYGGVEALASWGVDETLLAGCDAEAILAAARDTIPAGHLRWIADLPISYSVGDYHFVHAGVRPGVVLERQGAEDALWIREPFLGSRRWHGAFVVHGHTITPDVDERTNRIGIDTGAYRTGRLTALGLEGAERWIVSPEPEPAPR